MSLVNPLKIRRLEASASGFDAELSALIAWESVADLQLENTVRTILASVKQRGDSALLEYTSQFDRFPADSMSKLTI